LIPLLAWVLIVVMVAVVAIFGMDMDDDAMIQTGAQWAGEDGVGDEEQQAPIAAIIIIIILPERGRNKATTAAAATFGDCPSTGIMMIRCEMGKGNRRLTPQKELAKRRGMMEKRGK